METAGTTALCATVREEREARIGARAASGLDECHVLIPANFIFHANAAVELDKVGADPEQDVLAVVDHFAGTGMLVGGCATAEIRTALEESDAETGVGKGAGGGQSGEAAAGYGY